MRSVKLAATLGVVATAVLGLLWALPPVVQAQIGPQPAPVKESLIKPGEKPNFETVKETVKESLKKMFLAPVPNADGTMGEDPEAAAKKPSMPKSPPLLTPQTGPEAEIAEPEISEESPPPVKLVQVDNPSNALGFRHAENRLKACVDLMSNEKYEAADTCLTTVRRWLVDATEGHINLYKTLNKVPSARAQAELEKQLALKFATLRDQALFRSGQLYVIKNEPQKATRELVEVVKSQPRSDMGVKAYEMLQSIGFTEKLQLVE